MSSSSSSSYSSSDYSSSSSSSSSSSDQDYNLEDDAAGVDLELTAEEFVSVLRTHDQVDAVRKKYDIPKNLYTACPAGDLRASSSPPHGAVCVYAHALEAGMRLPLHPFFVDVLNHFNLAPTQLAPNAWRIIVGFLVLCHSARVPPSLAVFRRFFLLHHKHKIAWYFFKTRRGSRLRITGLPDSIKGWKSGFFFLHSTTPWPCPVEWGKPSKSSLADPVLSAEDRETEAKLLSAYGASPVDLRKYLCRSNLAAAMISPSSAPSTPLPPAQQSSSPEAPAPQPSSLLFPALQPSSPQPPAPSSPEHPAPQPSSLLSPAPQPSSPQAPAPSSPEHPAPQPSSLLSPAPQPRTSYTRTATKGMDPAVYVMMKSMLAAKATVAQASASANKVKSEPDNYTTGSSPLCGKKRNLDEAYGDDGPLSYVLPNTPPASGASSLPGGFSRSRKMRHIPKGQDGDSTDWEAARERLQGVVQPQQERLFAANEPSDIVKSTYVSILQAAKYASFSLAYALELDSEVAALRTQLQKSEAKLAAAEAEVETLKAELTVRRRAQDALDGYEHWRGTNAGRRT
ncbi:hypothetical protein VPH35_135587 [Triticum aestivum]|uniref:uncharacterized protein n=1 Tax=Triticum aestivum TaxID=4565 RepID=UPI001D00DA5E|nr:uncharacterized protein LOC123168222 [Triticum aestivum]